MWPGYLIYGGCQCSDLWGTPTTLQTILWQTKHPSTTVLKTNRRLGRQLWLRHNVRVWSLDSNAQNPKTSQAQPICNPCAYSKMRSKQGSLEAWVYGLLKQGGKNCTQFVQIATSTRVNTTPIHLHTHTNEHWQVRFVHTKLHTALNATL